MFGELYVEVMHMSEFETGYCDLISPPQKDENSFVEAFISAIFFFQTLGRKKPPSSLTSAACSGFTATVEMAWKASGDVVVAMMYVCIFMERAVEKRKKKYE